MRMDEPDPMIMAAQPRRNIAQTVKEYGQRLFGFIRGRVKTDEDAEDILQDVWFQLSNAVNVDEIEQISGWLFQVARNRIIDRYRKKETDSLEDFTYESEEGTVDFREILMAEDGNPEMEFMREVFWQELFKALEELPEAQRKVFIQNELEGKKLKQIAEENGENLKTVISRKGYAVKHLRKRMATLYEELLNY